MHALPKQPPLPNNFFERLSSAHFSAHPPDKRDAAKSGYGIKLRIPPSLQAGVAVDVANLHQRALQQGKGTGGLGKVPLYAHIHDPPLSSPPLLAG